MQPHKIVSQDRMARRAQGVPRNRKAIHPARDELSRQRRELPWVKVDKPYVFDGPRRQGDAGRAVRRPQPVDRLSLHVRSGLGAGLPELLVPRRSFRRRHRSSRAARRHPARGLARAAAADRSVQEAHGLALQVGVVVRQRLQPRLPRVVHQGRAGAEQGLLQLRARPIPGRRSARRQRVLSRMRRATSSTPIRPTHAGSTFWSAPTTCSTSCRRAATRRRCRAPWRGSATTTATRISRNNVESCCA